MIGDKLIMSQKERNRKVVIEDVIKKRISLKEGGEEMGVTYRQAKRIKKRY